jgi:DNA-binding Lrp family transcriptional regulator
MAKSQQSFFLQYLGDNPKMRILDFLMDNFAHDFSLPQIAEGSNVAYTTLIDILPRLLEQGILIETRKIGKSTLYKINLDNPVAKALFVIDMKLSEAAIEKVLA